MVTREQWLCAGVVALRPKFESVGYALPEVIHTSIGFPSRGALARRTRVVGQCWNREASKDGNCQIFISPVLIGPVEVLDTLAHELVHVVTPGAKHRGKFITASRAVGLTENKPTSASAGAELKTLLERIATWETVPDVGGGRGRRLLIASSPRGWSSVNVPNCGYTARTSRKWLEVGPPICPACRVDTEVIESIARLNGNTLGGLLS